MVVDTGLLTPDWKVFWDMEGQLDLHHVGPVCVTVNQFETGKGFNGVSEKWNQRKRFTSFRVSPRFRFKFTIDLHPAINLVECQFVVRVLHEHINN